MIRRLIAILCLCLGAWNCGARNGIWLDIDTQRATLKVMQGDRERTSFENIALGRYGTARHKQAGDNKTPIGSFNIAWIKYNSRFHLFLGLNYPTLDISYRAFRNGAISLADWQQIRQALANGQTPPQNTPLGGYIGIHGIGAGDPYIHATYNWTNGCIAITNEQIEQLQQWVRIGTPVEIH